MGKTFAAFALFCCAFEATAQPARSQRSVVANGQDVYLRVGCFTCHGTVGHGGAAPRLAPNTLPLASFETWVRNGTPGWSIMSGMPAYPVAVLDDANLADVRAFLASLPAPPPADEIPLLSR